MFVQQLADVSVTLPGALTELLVLSWEKHRQGGMWFLQHRCVQDEGAGAAVGWQSPQFSPDSGTSGAEGRGAGCRHV